MFNPLAKGHAEYYYQEHMSAFDRGFLYCTVELVSFDADPNLNLPLQRMSPQIAIDCDQSVLTYCLSQGCP